EIKVYSNESGIEGKIGAAAVLYRDGRQRTTMQYQLGSDTMHTVYEGEVVGTGLGVELLRTQKRARSASFYIDNQVCLLGTQSIRSNPGHYLLDHVHVQVERVLKHHPNLHLTMRWIPGHSDNTGNEAVDEEAKEAAKGESSAD
ncbi:hypothetical protein FIBSPDRAFT_686736, partial [Athelia psychrophila]